MKIPFPRMLFGWIPVGCIQSGEVVLAINRGTDSKYEITMLTSKGEAAISMLCSGAALEDLKKILSTTSYTTGVIDHECQIHRK